MCRHNNSMCLVYYCQQMPPFVSLHHELLKASYSHLSSNSIVTVGFFLTKREKYNSS